MDKTCFVVAGTGLPEIISLIEGVCEDDPSHEFVGFIDDNPENRIRDLYGYPFLGGFEYLNRYKGIKVVNSIARNTQIRRLSTERILSLGGSFINLIHPTVLRHQSSLGIGNVIDRSCILSRGVSIGSHNLFLSNVIVGHDCKLGDNNFFGHRVLLNGSVSVENNCFIGAGSMVAPHISIQSDCSIGMGCVLSSDALSNSVYLPRPASFFRAQGFQK